MPDELSPLPEIPQHDWDATPPTVRAVVVALLAHQQQLSHRIADLEVRVNQTSQNSSKPPSSDPPDAPPRPPRTPRGKVRGGQPGHPGTQRPLVPPDQVQAVVAYHPTTCPACQTDLSPDLPDATPVSRHQVWEIPPIRPHITEHRLHTVACPHCRHPVRAELPVAARSGYGPHATALAGLLHGRYRLSVRETSAVLEDVCGLPMSESSVVTSCVRVSAALEPVYQHVRDTVAQQPVSNIDETSWQELGHRRWLWVFVTAVATLFQVAQGRGKAVWRDVMGTAYGGILGSDRLAAYNAHPIDRRQVCWAHLQRNLRAIEERGGVVGAWANETLTWVQMLFTIWHTFRDDHKDRAMLQAAMEPVQDGLWDCLQRGREVPWSKARALSGEMLRLWDGLWTFVEVVGVEPTNNVAERALRPAVLWRKGSFGTQSVAGSRFVERMLTVRETCRQQQIHILAFLTEAVQAHWHGTPAPQLIPPP